MDDVARTIYCIVDNAEKFKMKRVDAFGTQDYLYAKLTKFVYDITQQIPNLWEISGEGVKYPASVT